MIVNKIVNDEGWVWFLVCIRRIMVDVWFWVVVVSVVVLVGLVKGGLFVFGVLVVFVLFFVMNFVIVVGLFLLVYIVFDVFGVWIY